jgi:hypothetical protein
VPLRLRVTYGRTGDFLADVERQVSRRGLLVRVELGAVERGEAVELEVVTPAGRVLVPASVLQPLPGAGVAVELDPERFAQLVEAAKRGPMTDGPAPVHERIAEAAAPSPADDEPPVTAQGNESATVPRAPGVKVSDMALHAQQQAQKIQLALHGDKNQRAAILREPNRLFHGYVLRNPQLQLDEVVFIARMPTVSAETLVFIASRREWAERSEVAIAIVRNPKTPLPLAVRMLDHVGAGELRALAKQQSVRDGIQRAARKKILG